MSVYILMAFRPHVVLTYMYLLDLVNTLHVDLIWSKEIRFSSVKKKISNWQAFKLFPLIPVYWEQTLFTPHAHSSPSCRSQSVPVFCYQRQSMLLTEGLVCFMSSTQSVYLWFCALVSKALFLCVMLVKKRLTTGLWIKCRERDW